MRRTVSFCCHNNRRFPLPPRAPAGFSVSLQCGAAWTGKGGRGVCAWHQAVAGVAGQGEAVGAEEAQGLRGRLGAKGPGPGAAGRGRGPRPGGRAFAPRRPLTPPSRGGGRPAGGPQRATPLSRHSFRRLRVSGAQATGRRGPEGAPRAPHPLPRRPSAGLASRTLPGLPRPRPPHVLSRPRAEPAGPWVPRGRLADTGQLPGLWWGAGCWLAVPAGRPAGRVLASHSEDVGRPPGRGPDTRCSLRLSQAEQRPAVLPRWPQPRPRCGGEATDAVRPGVGVRAGPGGLPHAGLQEWRLLRGQRPGGQPRGCGPWTDAVSRVWSLTVGGRRARGAGAHCQRLPTAPRR